MEEIAKKLSAFYSASTLECNEPKKNKRTDAIALEVTPSAVHYTLYGSNKVLWRPAGTRNPRT
jgi:hypothetical protein